MYTHLKPTRVSLWVSAQSYYIIIKSLGLGTLLETCSAQKSKQSWTSKEWWLLECSARRDYDRSFKFVYLPTLPMCIVYDHYLHSRPGPDSRKKEAMTSSVGCRKRSLVLINRGLLTRKVYYACMVSLVTTIGKSCTHTPTSLSFR